VEGEKSEMEERVRMGSRRERERVVGHSGRGLGFSSGQQQKIIWRQNYFFLSFPSQQTLSCKKLRKPSPHSQAQGPCLGGLFEWAAPIPH